MESEKSKGRSPDYYKIVRNTIVWLYFGDLIGNILLTIIGESFALLYTYQVQELIEFIKEPVDTLDPEGQTWRGVQTIIIFGTTMYISQLARNRVFLKGTQITLRARRTLVVSLYDKVLKLSMKSLTETNSGKLISLISADLFMIEKGLSLYSFIVTAPFINGLMSYLLYQKIGLVRMFIVLSVWIVTLILQMVSGATLRKLKAKESTVNDERLKFVNDVVVGCRTIKCYAWEQHYLKAITSIRDKQKRQVMWVNVLSSLGDIVYMNMGLVAILIILIIDWSQGTKLDTGVVISTMAMVFFVFMAVNVIFYFSFINVQNFLVVLFRLSKIFEMEEHVDRRSSLKTGTDKG